MGRERSAMPATLGLCGGYFLVLLDVTVVNVALPSIGTGLHATASGLAWVVDAYTVPLAALLLASGAVGDNLGHRRVVVTGFCGFGTASVVCALAPGMTVLIAGRALQGVCAALMLPGTLAMLAESAPDDRARARAVGLWAAVGGAALPAGPFLGGALAEAAGWRAVFWLNVPVIVAALVTVGRPAPSGRHRALGSRPARSAHHQAREDGVPLIERAARRPLLLVPASARRPLAAACVVAGLMNFCALGSLFLLTQVFQDAHGLSPLEAGLLLLPAMLPLPLLGTLAGRLTARIGPWRGSAVGLSVAAAGLAGIAASVGRPVYAALLGSLALWGAGLGILTPAIVTAALRATPGAPGTASGASNTARQAGGALGVAVFAALAGSANHSSFVRHASWLLIASAAAFTLAAIACLGAARAADERPRVSPSHDPAGPPRRPETT